jgi:hypothetical protein
LSHLVPAYKRNRTYKKIMKWNHCKRKLPTFPILILIIAKEI